VNVEVACPACERSEWRDVDALVGSGKAPKTTIACRCGCTYTVLAVLELSVRKVATGVAHG
jgi:hypothetical protein